MYVCVEVTLVAFTDGLSVSILFIDSDSFQVSLRAIDSQSLCKSGYLTMVDRIWNTGILYGGSFGLNERYAIAASASFHSF